MKNATNSTIFLQKPFELLKKQNQTTQLNVAQTAKKVLKTSLKSVGKAQNRE